MNEEQCAAVFEKLIQDPDEGLRRVMVHINRGIMRGCRMSRPLPAEPLLTKQEAALVLRMSVKTLLLHIAAGRLRFINVGTAKPQVHRFTT